MFSKPDKTHATSFLNRFKMSLRSLNKGQNVRGRYYLQEKHSSFNTIPYN